MQKPPTKAQLRESLESDLAEFLDAGNSVTQVPKGVSGKEAGENYVKRAQWQMEKSEGERTYIPEIVQALDERKRPKTQTPPKRKPRPRKKLIYDDFGEPLRWVWVDE